MGYLGYRPIFLEPILMKPPIIFNDNGDVLLFTSVSSAEQYLEPEDIREKGECEVYDSEGRKLGISIVSKRTSFLFFPINREHLELRAIDTDPRHAAQLRELLTEFLTQVLESTESLEDRSLDELIQVALKFNTR